MSFYNTHHYWHDYVFTFYCPTTISSAGTTLVPINWSDIALLKSTDFDNVQVRLRIVSKNNTAGAVNSFQLYDQFGNAAVGSSFSVTCTAANTEYTATSALTSLVSGTIDYMIMASADTGTYTTTSLYLDVYYMGGSITNTRSIWNCRNQNIEFAEKFGIQDYALSATDYTTLTGSTFPIDRKRYSALAKAKIIISWGRVASTATTGYLQVCDQDNTVLCSITDSSFPIAPVEGTTWGHYWVLLDSYVSTTTLFDVPMGTTSLYLKGKTSAEAITISRVDFFLLLNP